MDVGHLCATRFPGPRKSGRNNRQAKNAQRRASPKACHGGRWDLRYNHQLGYTPAGGRPEKRSNPGNTKEDDDGRGRVPTQHPRHSESSKHALLEDDDDIEEVQATRSLDEQSQSSETRLMKDATKKHQRQGTRDMLRLLSHDGTEFQVPKEVGTLLAELIARVRSMEERLVHHQRQAAFSTRMTDNRPDFKNLA